MMKQSAPPRGAAETPLYNDPYSNTNAPNQANIPQAHPVENEGSRGGFNIKDEFSAEVLKLPYGFVKVLELVFTIIAWQTLASYSVETMYISQQCPNRVQSLKFGYPFPLKDVRISANSCDTTATVSNLLFTSDYVGCSRFFVTISGISFMFALVMLLVYLFLRIRLYDKYEAVRRIDCVAHMVLTVFWTLVLLTNLFCIGGIKGQVSLDNVKTSISSMTTFGHGDKACNPTPGCTFQPDWTVASLTIAELAGLACWLLFGANVWFIFRETTWFTQNVHRRLAIDVAAKLNLNVNINPNGGSGSSNSANNNNNNNNNNNIGNIENATDNSSFRTWMQANTNQPNRGAQGGSYGTGA